MFCWGIIPFCETLYEGMKKVFYKMGLAFQVFKVDEDAQFCHSIHNWDKHRIHLVVDGLPSRQFFLSKT